jgi:hypothetical protein
MRRKNAHFRSSVMVKNTSLGGVGVGGGDGHDENHANHHQTVVNTLANSSNNNITNKKNSIVKNNFQNHGMKEIEQSFSFDPFASRSQSHSQSRSADTISFSKSRSGEIGLSMIAENNNSNNNNNNISNSNKKNKDGIAAVDQRVKVRPLEQKSPLKQSQSHPQSPFHQETHQLQSNNPFQPFNKGNSPNKRNSNGGGVNLRIPSTSQYGINRSSQQGQFQQRPRTSAGVVTFADGKNNANKKVSISSEKGGRNSQVSANKAGVAGVGGGSAITSVQSPSASMGRNSTLHNAFSSSIHGRKSIGFHAVDIQAAAAGKFLVSFDFYFHF